MAFTVNVSHNAANELEQAIDYIARQFASPHAMSSLLDAFDVSIEALAANPFAYSGDEAMSEIVGIEIRKVAVKRYIMRYSIHDETCEVRIYSLLHSLQDASKRFVVDYFDAISD